jgi:hypothetical protein
MNLKQGKITIMSMIAFCILVLAAAMAFNHVAGAVDKKQIKKEIYDGMGTLRGTALTEEKTREIVIQVLGKRSLKPLEIYAEIDDKAIIHFSYKYELTINYILFKRIEIVEVADKMENYGG